MTILSKTHYQFLNCNKCNTSLQITPLGDCPERCNVCGSSYTVGSLTETAGCTNIDAGGAEILEDFQEKYQVKTRKKVRDDKRNHDSRRANTRVRVEL